MANTVKVEVWVCVGSAGDYTVGTDADVAREAYDNDVETLSECDGFRMVKVTVDVPLPEVSEVTVAQASEQGAASPKGWDHV